jgi:hypothetical protein
MDEKPGAPALRMYAACAILIPSAAVQLPRKIQQWAAPEPRHISLEYIERFQEARKFLPPRNPIGYMDEQVASGTNLGLDEGYHLTQYALVPGVLRMGGDHDWVITNFARPEDAAAFAQKNGFAVEKDFKNGVMLLSAQARR